MTAPDAAVAVVKPETSRRGTYDRGSIDGLAVRRVDSIPTK
jgi:hypothetical protein